MKTQLVFVSLVFFLKHKPLYASMWQTQRYTEKDVYLSELTLESFKVDTLFGCYSKCENKILCTSINMILTDKTCELKYSTKSRHPEKIVNRPNTIYMEIRDDNAAQGSRPDIPIAFCKKLKENESHAKSGVYWMKFDDLSSEPFKVFCEMTIDGGGWTLVYSYTFTHYNTFNSIENAITPIPNWPVSWSPSDWVPQSTTTPLSESSYTAMDFALWKKIGNEFLIKSNITNWISCVEGVGSLVNWVGGSLTCRVVKGITTICITVAPNKLLITTSCGPYLILNTNMYIYLEGKRVKCRPFHDPCGTKSVNNHLTNVPNPSGAIYIR